MKPTDKTVYYLVQGGTKYKIVTIQNESYCTKLSFSAVYYAVQGGSNFLSLWMKS